jgi:hypothetical protein
MGLPYLKDKEGKTFSWSEVTREERYFCAELFFETRHDVKKFVECINNKAIFNKDELKLDEKKDWELGYEVCFYRDLRKLHGLGIKKSKYSEKRTFDLCLFTDDRIVIIEAKVQSGVTTKQLESFEDDKSNVDELLKELYPSLGKVDVSVLGLFSSGYIKGLEKKKKTISPIFDGHITWIDLYEAFPMNEALRLADERYGK